MTKGIMSPPANVRPQFGAGDATYLENVGIEQRLDSISRRFRRTSPSLTTLAALSKLGDYYGKKPLILNLVYYNCTMLCGEALAGLTGALKMVKFDIGKEFEVVTVSFNPKETPQIAAREEAGLFAALWPSRCSCGLAFSDRTA
jgi:hypothetical protein